MTDLSEAKDLNVSAFWRVLPQDMDPVETREWIEAFKSIVEMEGSVVFVKMTGTIESVLRNKQSFTELTESVGLGR